MGKIKAQDEATFQANHEKAYVEKKFLLGVDELMKSIGEAWGEAYFQANHVESIVPVVKNLEENLREVASFEQKRRGWKTEDMATKLEIIKQHSLPIGLIKIVDS